MQLTRQSEYAIRIMLELARLPFGEVLSSKVISERQEIPEEFLKKTVQLLSLNGLVITQRGIQGGVRLGRPGGEITIADIVAGIEGPLALNPCLSPGYQCKNSGTCVVHSVLMRAQNAVLKELGKETLADLAASDRKLT
jgi:Rrf2 family protein